MKSKIRIIFFFTIFLCVVFRFQIGDFLLSTFGRICIGKVTSEVRSVKYVKPTFLYSFIVKNESYVGNSMIADSSLIGDEICIIYFPLMPSLNRPAKFLMKECNNNNAAQ